MRVSFRPTTAAMRAAMLAAVMALSACVGGSDFRIYEVPEDLELQQMMIEAEELADAPRGRFRSSSYDYASPWWPTLQQEPLDPPWPGVLQPRQ